MCQYGVAAFVEGIAINHKLRLVLAHFCASEICTLVVTPHPRQRCVSVPIKSAETLLFQRPLWYYSTALIEGLGQRPC